jgi:hypothetical protein
MAIHVGIRCLECGRVYFLLALKRLTKTSTEGVYQITCISPCGAITYFGLRTHELSLCQITFAGEVTPNLGNTNQVRLLSPCKACVIVTQSPHAVTRVIGIRAFFLSSWILAKKRKKYRCGIDER